MDTCPFCPHLLDDPTLYEPVTPAVTINDIPACSSCANFVRTFMEDDEVRDQGATAVPMTRLTTPEPCSAVPCTNIAYWRYAGCAGPVALCYDCMRRMSDMNSDNEDVFAVALQAAGQEVQA